MVVIDWSWVISISFAYDRSTIFTLKTLRAIHLLHLKLYQRTLDLIIFYMTIKPNTN